MRLTQRKGDLATTQAISTFTRMGFDVSIPVTESASYDLVIDTCEGLKRVQVKYSSTTEVDLRNIHSNSNGYVVKKAKQNAYDWLYILFEREDVIKEYLLKECFVNRRSISLTLHKTIMER